MTTSARSCDHRDDGQASGTTATDASAVAADTDALSHISPDPRICPKLAMRVKAVYAHSYKPQPWLDKYMAQNIAPSLGGRCAFLVLCANYMYWSLREVAY